MQHPNLFFSKDDVEKYKQKLAVDDGALKRYETAVADAEKCLAEEFVSEEEANGGVGQHSDFGKLNHQANRFADVLGTKYLVDGDERCAEKLKKLLLHFIKFERWHSSSYSVRFPVPWHADLCSTAATLAFARIYDVIYNYLTPGERKTIAKGIFEKGVLPAFSDWVLPETRIHELDSMGHNWWSVCISEPATALLALYDELPDQCERLIKLADEALSAYLTYGGNRLFNKIGNFDRQGFFYESAGYNNYGTGTLLMYLWCNERYFGFNKVIRSSLPADLCDSLMLFSYPVTRDGTVKYDFLNFGDSDVVTDYSFISKYALRLGIASDAMKACLKTYSVGICEEIGGLSLENLGGSFDSLPKSRLFSCGYAVSHASYEPDSTVLAVKSGYCWNHSHNDSGTFVIFHNGRPLFIDSGTCNYNSPLYHAYYCQDVSHSVLRIGNNGRRDEELYRGTKFPGTITDYYEGEDFLFVQADSTGPMAHLCSRMFRNFLWLDNRILVIFDEVYCHKDDSVQFTLHFDADFSHSGNVTEFDNGVSKARLVSHFPEMSYTVKQGHPPHKENEDMPYIELSTKEEKRTHLLVNTIEIEPENNPVSFSEIKGENYDGIMIKDDKCVRKIIMNRMADGHIMHDNSNNIIEGFETDAYMLMIKEDKICKKSQIFAVCAGYVRRNGQVLHSSFTKMTNNVSFCS